MLLYTTRSDFSAMLGRLRTIAILSSFVFVECEGDSIEVFSWTSSFPSSVLVADNNISSSVISYEMISLSVGSDIISSVDILSRSRIGSSRKVALGHYITYPFHS